MPIYATTKLVLTEHLSPDMAMLPSLFRAHSHLPFVLTQNLPSIETESHSEHAGFVNQLPCSPLSPNPCHEQQPSIKCNLVEIFQICSLTVCQLVYLYIIMGYSLQLVHLLTAHTTTMRQFGHHVMVLTPSSPLFHLSFGSLFRSNMQKLLLSKKQTLNCNAIQTCNIHSLQCMSCELASSASYVSTSVYVYLYFCFTSLFLHRILVFV